MNEVLLLKVKNLVILVLVVLSGLWPTNEMTSFEVDANVLYTFVQRRYMTVKLD